MRRPGGAVMAAAFVAALVAVGCGVDSDVSGNATAPRAITTNASVAPSSSAAPTDDPAAQAAASAALEEFFAAFSAADFARAATLVEHGATWQPTFHRLYDALNVASSALGAVPRAVTITGNEAQVVYDLTFAGAVALPDSSALMVSDGGTWKVSEATWSELLALAPEEE